VETHRDGAALADHGDHRVVAAGPASGRVDDEPDGLVLHEREERRLEHVRDVALAEDLLERVEREAGELGLDEVGTVLFWMYLGWGKKWVPGGPLNKRLLIEK
jgi:hypothetical protein